MAKRGVKIKADALVKIRQLPVVHAELLRRGKAIAKDAGGEDMGYMVTDLVLEDPRGAVSVMATGKAHFHNRKNHSLIRSIDAGKGDKRA